MKLHHLSLLIFINACWGFNFIAGKEGTELFGPLLFSAIRFLVVFLLLLPFARWQSGQMKTILLIGIVLGVVHYPVMFSAMYLTDNISAVAIAAQLVVPFSTIVAVLYLKERIGVTRTVAITLSFLGVVVISFEPVSADHVLSLILTTIASAAMAAAAILMRKLDNTGAFNLQFWIAATASVSLVLLTVVIEAPSVEKLLSFRLVDYWSPVYSAIGATIIGHGSFYYLLQRYEVNDVAPFITLSSLFAVGFGILLFGDQMTWRIVLGGLLTLVGVTVVAMRGAKIAANAKAIALTDEPALRSGVRREV